MQQDKQKQNNCQKKPKTFHNTMLKEIKSFFFKLIKRKWQEIFVIGLRLYKWFYETDFGDKPCECCSTNIILGKNISNSLFFL